MMLRLPALLVGAFVGATPIAAQLPPGARLDTIARGLANPWALAFAPDGRVFVSERPGRIRVIGPAGLAAAPWAVLPVAPRGPGLLGLALAPDFAQSGQLFVVGGFAGAHDSLFVNRLLRLTERDRRGAEPTILRDSLPSARAHAGSAVAFGPDGWLYVSLGDAFQPAAAADPSHLAGKILRLDARGRPAPGNPTPGAAVWARGLRNVQGLAWDPRTGALFATEHGPSNWPWEEGRRDADEVNQIVAGGDYGWPAVTGRAGTAAYQDPLVTWTPAIAPSGIAFYNGPFAPWRPSLLVGALRGRHLRRLALAREGGGWRVVAEETLLAADSLGRIRAVAIGPDGQIWFTTSDRRGPDGLPDDRVYRLVLPEDRP